jgi:hypothetical protein
MRDFAERLLACEMTANQKAADLPAMFRVCEKLRANLVGLMGTSGFTALLGRALALAGAEISWLRTVRTTKDGSLEGLDEFRARFPADQIAEGGVVLVARLLGVLVDLIGSGLTTHLLRQIWPKLSVEDLKVEKETKNENAKQIREAQTRR